jgi:transglutaminase-like putative cysteine protease
MRRLAVIHETQYRYGAMVEHAHHWVRLRPIQDATQQIRSFALAIDPMPRYRSERRDAHGVAEVRFEMDSPHRELLIRSRTLVEMAGDDPLQAGSVSRAALWSGCSPNPIADRPWEDAARLLNFTAGAPWQPAATQVCSSALAFSHPALREWAAQTFTPGRPLREGAWELMHRVHTKIQYVPAATDVNTTALEAMTLGRGVCQDLAHVMIAALRSLGLAARYVSGYLLTQPPPGKPRLIGADASHAWVSVWCPEAGWFELDPTNNRAPGDDYVTLARGRDYGDIAPVRGVIRGGGAHTLAVRVTVTDLDEENSESLSALAVAGAGAR